MIDLSLARIADIVGGRVVGDADATVDAPAAIDSRQITPGGLFVAFPPSSGLVAGMWLFPAVLGGLLIRKPGAALFTEMVAAAVSALALSPARSRGRVGAAG